MRVQRSKGYSSFVFRKGKLKSDLNSNEKELQSKYKYLLYTYWKYLDLHKEFEKKLSRIVDLEEIKSFWMKSDQTAENRSNEGITDEYYPVSGFPMTRQDFQDMDNSYLGYRLLDKRNIYSSFHKLYEIKVTLTISHYTKDVRYVVNITTILMDTSGKQYSNRKEFDYTDEGYSELVNYVKDWVTN